MATLKKAKDDGHFFILGGPSEGTFQIEPEGLKWLSKQMASLPSVGKPISLEIGTLDLLSKENEFTS